MRAVRQHEAQGLDQMRCIGEQHFPLCQCLAHQAEFIVFQIAQSTVDQFAARRRGGAGQIRLFAQGHGQATSARVGGNAGTIDPATHDEQIVSRRIFGQFGGEGGDLAGHDGCPDTVTASMD